MATRRRSYVKVGQFPDNYRFIQVGDSCIVIDERKIEFPSKIVQISMEGSTPFMHVQFIHSGNIYPIYPKGVSGIANFGFKLKIKGTSLGSKLMIRAKQERAGIFQGDLILPFGK